MDEILHGKYGVGKNYEKKVIQIEGLQLKTHCISNQTGFPQKQDL